MNRKQLKLLIDTKIAGQGDQIDVGNALPAVLNGIIDKISDRGQEFLSLERLRHYLYKITFDNLPEDNGGSNPVSGGCSAFVQGGKLYRNLDFKYDEAASFIVRTRNYVGMSFVTGLNDGELVEDLLKQLPYRVVDGVNNNGVKVSTHILFNDWGWKGTGNKTIPVTRIPYLVLERVKSMATIESDLDGVLDNLYAPEMMGDYLLQVLVTDGTTSYAILPATTEDGPFVLQNITAYPKLTNFRWVASSNVTRSELQERPTGVERFNLMPCSLEALRFTKAYESEDRLSEFIGIDETTKDSTDEELAAVYAKAHALYLERQRDGKTWQTMHSVVYGDQMEQLYIQENWNDEIIRGRMPEEKVLMVQSESYTTVGGYQVPALTAEQVQQAYNAVVAGRGCIIIDSEEKMHAYINQADCLNDELSIAYLYYSTLLLTYTLSDDSVIITHVEL